MFNITWFEMRRRVTTTSAVLALLETLERSCPGQSLLVTVERGNGGDLLSIGIGSACSVLSYVPHHRDPPYLVSVGTDPSEGDDLSFIFGNSPSEFPSRNGIDPLAARRAMEEFCERGALSEAIGWEEV